MSASLLPSYSSALFYAGPLFSIGGQITNAQVAGKILTTRTVGGLSPVPFACMFTNGLLWLYYGALKNDPVIYGPNATGAIIGVGCIIAYESKSTVGNLLTYGAFLCVCVVATVLAFWNDVDNLGYVGCGLSVVNTAAPLATLPTVIRERSTAALPLNPILMNFFGSLSWALYGILVVKDPMIYGPNFLGILLCVMQLSLFIIYSGPAKSLPQ